MTPADAAACGDMSAEQQAPVQPLRVTVVYNNVPYAPELTTAWGFATVIEAGPGTLLLDTSGDGPTLLGNMQHLGIDPKSIDAVALSHIHGDHTGGLADLLAHRPKSRYICPRLFRMCSAARWNGAGQASRTWATRDTCSRTCTSIGEMSQGTDEQALIIDTPTGLVAMTGCSHPDIVDIATTARTFCGKDIHLLMGGSSRRTQRPRFARHAASTSRPGRAKVAPSHCTGDRAIALFRQRWGNDFAEGGCGSVIEIP